MAEMSIKEQIRALEGMERDLQESCKVMEEMIEETRKDIQYLRGEGFSLEKEEDYMARFFNPAKANVETVINSIARYHIRYLDDVIQDLTDILRV